jgi:small conductance mechanosensitive channel
MRPRLYLSVVALVLSWGIYPQAQNFAKAQPSQTQTQATQSKAASETAPEEPSTAERIIQLKRSIKENQQRLEELQTKLNGKNGKSEFTIAEEEFNKLDEELKQKQEKLKELREQGQEEEAAKLKKKIEDLKKRWQLAKDRLELALKEQQALKQQVETVQEQIKRDREILKKLAATTQPATQPATQPETSPETPQTTTATATTPEETAPQKKEAAAEKKPKTTLPIPQLPGVGATGETKPVTQDQQPAKELTEEEKEAQEEVQAHQNAVQEAQEELNLIDEQIESVEKNIELEQQLLQTAQQKAENARQTEKALSERVRKLSTEGAAKEKIDKVWSQIFEAQQRANEAQQEIEKHREEIVRLRELKAQREADQAIARDKLEDAKEELEEAKEELEVYENPFSLYNIKRWFKEHGPDALATLVRTIVIALILLGLVRIVDNRIIRFIAKRTDRGSPEERENRAKTLSSVFHNTATIVILVWAILTILPAFGMDITALMGGVAVVGLAVAFGAQNLIRDYFYGFMMLMENQYGINDVVRIGSVAGLVERITLRVTVLRDLEGITHFIPNGQITQVSNFTHKWSRVSLDIGVSYNEDSDHVMSVMTEVAEELYNDPDFGPLILEQPQLLGLDAFGDSAIVFKIIIKTKTLKQWDVKRAYLYRLKKRFDKEGIEIPFPHRTVYHRTEEEKLCKFLVQQENQQKEEQ